MVEQELREAIQEYIQNEPEPVALIHLQDALESLKSPGDFEADQAYSTHTSDQSL